MNERTNLQIDQMLLFGLRHELQFLLRLELEAQDHRGEYQSGDHCVTQRKPFS